MNGILPSAVLEQLSFARRIADYADNLGVRDAQITVRTACDHLGAVLADAILQAGVRYRTVVRMRVERMHSHFPDAATMPGLILLLEQQGAAELLLWKHPIKMSRFVSLTRLLSAQNVGSTLELKVWLRRDDARDLLLSLHGIGPKTYDYLCGLVGIDCIAVDRHVRTFASEAGVPINDYDRLQSVVSYAADLLGIARRDFDAWMWRTVSERDNKSWQLSLL
jgi:hypothetical protein